MAVPLTSIAHKMVLSGWLRRAVQQPLLNISRYFTVLLAYNMEFFSNIKPISQRRVHFWNRFLSNLQVHLLLTFKLISFKTYLIEHLTVTLNHFIRSPWELRGSSYCSSHASNIGSNHWNAAAAATSAAMLIFILANTEAVQ